MNLHADIETAILAARILVVDDQSANVQLLSRMLADAGYTQVSGTQAPAEVAALHRAQAFDLILLDLQMPGMDGFQVMEALKTNARDAYLPVIVLTAQPGHKLRALQAGAKDFISKPFDLGEVRTRIHNMLEVRLLYRQLETHNDRLEQLVLERTAELRESEARYRSLTELASDWYWEQDEQGAFTKVSGPVLEMLGIRMPALDGEVGAAGGTGAAEAAEAAEAPEAAEAADAVQAAIAEPALGWDPQQRAELLAYIEARQPFLDFALHRTQPDGSRQHFRVSGQPMFDRATRFLGYRGIGVETMGGP